MLSRRARSHSHKRAAPGFCWWMPVFREFGGFQHSSSEAAQQPRIVRPYTVKPVAAKRAHQGAWSVESVAYVLSSSKAGPTRHGRGLLETPTVVQTDHDARAAARDAITTARHTETGLQSPQNDVGPPLRRRQPACWQKDVP